MSEPQINIRKAFALSRYPVIGPLIKSLSRKQAGKGNHLRANVKVTDLIFDFFAECNRPNPYGKSLVWVNLPSVTEIFYAMDLIPYMPETYGGLMASMKYSVRALDAADSLGYSRDSCTFCNHVLGAVELQELPSPAMVCATMFTLCDAQGKALETAARKLGVPFHQINLPSITHRQIDIDFMVEELLSLVKRLEQLTGRKMTVQALEDTVKKSNRAVMYFERFLGLRKNVPPPIGGFDALTNCFPIYNFLGNIDRTGDFFRDLCSELESLISAGATTEQDPKKSIRLLSMGHYHPLYDHELIKSLERENVFIVNEVFNAVSMGMIKEPTEPSIEGYLRSLAEKYMTMSTTAGSLDERFQICQIMAEEWKVDGLVSFVPWGCRMIASSVVPGLDRMSKQLGLPSIVIDADPLDQSIYARGSVSTRLQAFAEMLKQKKQGGQLRSQSVSSLVEAI